MSNIARWTNSWISAVNENTLALANINVDFSLMKFEAPSEFLALGESLSKHRREEAEIGSTHQTARRLGALFEGIVPQTPQLVKQYGLRASEIANTPGVNPKGSRNDGPFEQFVGADATSLWAAATSRDNSSQTHPPLAMHLLACILASIWEPENAISIWVDLIRMRQEDIDSGLAKGEPQEISVCWAARQKIPRNELALWDASARAWLQSADEAKRFQRTQLQLIVGNLHLNFTHRTSTYQNVIKIWQHAMVGMEKCLAGSPQELSDGSILLALSAWHLYPDLIVMQESTKHVSFKDPLVPRSGAITIGLEFAPGSRPVGIHWSLILSHLRYYGDPVKVDSSGALPRITMKQLNVVIFGHLLSSWNVSKPREAIKTAEWLLYLWNFMVRSAAVIKKWHGWLGALKNAAEQYLICTKEDSETCSRLIGLGRRRCKNFLGSTTQFDSVPFFGLLSAKITAALKSPNPFEGSVAYLRAMAEEMRLSGTEAIIRYRLKFRRYDYIELITAIPHATSQQKRLFDGSAKLETVHCRWVGINTDLTQDVVSTHCDCTSSCDDCICSRTAGKCSASCHSGYGIIKDCSKFGTHPTFRKNEIRVALEERCVFMDRQQTETKGLQSRGPGLTFDGNDNPFSGEWTWKNPPNLFHNHSNPAAPVPACSSLSLTSSQCCCFVCCYRSTELYHPETFRLVYGSLNGLGLFVRVNIFGQDTEAKCKERHETAERLSIVFDTPGTIPAALDNFYQTLDGNIKFTRSLSEYFDLLWDEGQISQKPQEIRRGHFEQFFGSDVSGQGQIDPISTNKPYSMNDAMSLHNIVPLNRDYIRSLFVLRYATDLYSRLPGASIPMRVLGLRLHEAKWFSAEIENFVFPSSLKSIRPGDARSQRAAAFACIAMFESGFHNIEASYCDPVIALASTNSIYVIGELLADPADTGTMAIRRVVGNVGKPGISLLVLPQQSPRVRELGFDMRVVPHEPYDFSHQDCFKDTSLVLSFTEWTRPLHQESRGNFDEDIHFVESFISVHDRGQWVADIDASGLQECDTISEDCLCDENFEYKPDLTAIDCWEELLDAPDNIAVMRARGNWISRLAAVAIRAQLGNAEETLLLRPESQRCLHCLDAMAACKFPREIGVIID